MKRTNDLCGEIFMAGGPFFHIVSDGNRQELIFHDDADYSAAMNIIALIVALFRVKIISFSLMSNHIHIIIEGSEAESYLFFDEFKKRLKRYFREAGKIVRLDNFVCSVIEIQTLERLRNNIVYVHRNPFVVPGGPLPNTFRWGSGRYYFDTKHYDELVSAGCLNKFSELSLREKRMMTHSRLEYALPETYYVLNGIILPFGYVDVRYGESFFTGESQYMYYLSKKVESSSDVAAQLNEICLLTDEEAFALVRTICKTKYADTKVALLNSKQKEELVNALHFEYHLHNKQIFRVTKVPLAYLNERFPDSV